MLGYGHLMSPTWVPESTTGPRGSELPYAVRRSEEEHYVINPESFGIQLRVCRETVLGPVSENRHVLA